MRGLRWACLLAGWTFLGGTVGPVRSGEPFEARPPFRIAGGFLELAPGVELVGIQDALGRERVYREGETIHGSDARIQEIDVARRTVRVAWRGRTWVMGWDRSPASAAPALEEPGVYEVTPEQARAYRRDSFKTYWDQGTYLRVPEGIKILTLEAQAEVRKYGLREGDVVRTVNGADLSRIAGVADALKRLAARGVSEVAVEIIRDGEPREIRIAVGR